MLQKELNSLIIKFYEDVESLGIKFPVAEITRRTGANKGYVSSILNKNVEPSEKFIRKFEESFKEELQQLENPDMDKSPIKSMPQPKTNILDQLIPLVAKSEYEFQKKIGVPNGTINNSRKNDRKLTDNLIRKIMKAYPQVNEYWLMTGEGYPIAGNTINNTATPMQQTQEQDYRTKYEKLLEKTNDQLSDAMANMSIVIQELKEVKVSLDDSKTHFSRITAAQMKLMEKIADQMGVSDLPTAAPATAQPAYTGDSK